MFEQLIGLLQGWRVDEDIRQMDAEGRKGRILGFVKGLRLSAQVAYLTRRILSDKDVDVSWGHLIDESGELCSPECDIIIHRRGCYRQWNGGDQHPIMDFKFVECSQALAIISCKSYTKSIDKGYCPEFSEHGVQKFYFFRNVAVRVV
jgi:hypothetical protein